VTILREMVRREREPTGSWTSSKHQYNVHWASQVALLMNMFDAPWTMWGIIESLALGWNQTFQGYLRYNLKRGVRVDPVLFEPTPEKAAFIRPQSEKSEL
jgi:hypothetical protein